MAMIGGQTPPPQELPGDYKRRVVVKFRPDVRLPYTTDAQTQFANTAPREWTELTAAHPGIALVPYFSTLPEHTLRSLSQPQASQRAAVPPSFTQYFAIECPAGVDPEAVARTVASWPSVDTAYVEAGPTPPPVNPSDDPRNTNQHYEDAAPTGIDVRWAWAQADGSGVGFVDMERGWTLNHEDLVAAGINIISGVNTDYTGHGTAVLGEVVMVDNTIGGVGIAPFASARVVSQWRNGSTYNTAEAILSAAAVMKSGDVLLLEAQTTSSTMSGYLPVEVEQATFDAIEYTTSNGIIVVEAGGNGSNDLDTYKDSSGRFILTATATTSGIPAPSWSALPVLPRRIRAPAFPTTAAGSTVTVGATASTPLGTAGRATPPTRTPRPLAELRELLPSLQDPHSSCSAGSSSTASAIRHPPCAPC